MEKMDGALFSFWASSFVLFRRLVLSPPREQNLNEIIPFIFNASFRVNRNSRAHFSPANFRNPPFARR